MLDEMKAQCERDTEDISQARVASDASKPFESVPFGLRTTIPNDIDSISSFVDQLMNFVSRFRVVAKPNFEIELPLREALVNAIVHGNQNDPRKRVHVNCRCTAEGEVSISIQDEGRGFEHKAVPDPTSPDNQLRTPGRGIYLMRTLMDEVDFEQGGSVVHMLKRANADLDTPRKRQ